MVLEPRLDSPIGPCRMRATISICSAPFVMAEPGLVMVLAVEAQSSARAEHACSLGGADWATGDLGWSYGPDGRSTFGTSQRLAEPARNCWSYQDCTAAAQLDRPLTAAGGRVPFDSESARLVLFSRGETAHAGRLMLQRAQRSIR